MNVINRFGNLQTFDPQYDKKFNMPLQMMLRHIDKCGLVAKFDDSKQTTFAFIDRFIDTQTDTLLLLVNVALIVIRVEDLKILDMIPLIGTLRRKSVKKLPAGSHHIEVYFPRYSDVSHTFLFSSELDKQEWETKIIKVQRLDPEHPDNKAGSAPGTSPLGYTVGGGVYR